MTFDPKSRRDQEIVALLAFYMRERQEEVRVDTALWTSATGEMCERDRAAHDGPFAGMAHVSVGRRHAEHVLIAPNGEVLHLH